MHTTLMITKKSRVDIVICCGGGAEVLCPATFAGAVVLGARSSGGVEEVGSVGNGVVVVGGGTEDAGT